MARVREPASLTQPRSPRALISPKHVYVFGTGVEIHEIVQSAINGLDPKLIDPKFFGELYGEVDSKLVQLVKDGNRSATRAAQNTLVHIAKHCERERQRRENERLWLAKREEYEEMQRQKAEKRRRVVTQSDLDKSVELAIAGEFRAIEPYIYKSLAPELRRLQAESIKADDYGNAGKFNRAARRVAMLADDNRYEKITLSMAADWEERVDTARGDLFRTRMSVRERIEKAKEERDAAAAETQSKIDEVTQTFDSLRKGPVPSSYCKYSPKWLQLRQQEKALAKTKRFTEARVFNTEANALQQEEDIVFRKRYVEDLEMRRAKSVRGIKDSQAAKEAKAAEKFFIAERDGRKEIEHAEMALKRMELHYEQAEARANIGQPTAQLAATSRSVTLPSTRSRSVRTAGTCRVRRTARPVIEKSPSELFKQRRAINNIVYSKLTL